jgi:hypothetical protein
LEEQLSFQVGYIAFVVPDHDLAHVLQLASQRLTWVEQIRPQQLEQRQKPKVFPPVRCSCEKDHRGHLFFFNQPLSQLVAKGWTGVLIGIYMMRLINDEEVPRRTFEKPLMPSAPV